MSILRQYLPKGSVTKQPSELHIFADASHIAYGAIAFLCVNGNISFIRAKTTVVPLKQLTLPKLELMAALTAARLSSFITDALKFCNCSVNLWTDSQIVFTGSRVRKGTMHLLLIVLQRSTVSLIQIARDTAQH